MTRLAYWESTYRHQSTTPLTSSNKVSRNAAKCLPTMPKARYQDDIKKKKHTDRQSAEGVCTTLLTKMGWDWSISQPRTVYILSLGFWRDRTCSLRINIEIKTFWWESTFSLGFKIKLFKKKQTCLIGVKIFSFNLLEKKNCSLRIRIHFWNNQTCLLGVEIYSPRE